MSRYEERVLRLRNHVLGHRVNKNEGTEKPKADDKKDSNTIAYDDVTKSDISKLLDDKGIEHNMKQTKQELYDLLLGSD